MRREFNLPKDLPPLAAESVALRVHHDEDTEVYLNGTEAARLPRWTSGYLEAPVNAEAVRTLRAGKNVMAIHCRQNGGGQYIDAGLVQFVRPNPPSNAKQSP